MSKHTPGPLEVDSTMGKPWQVRDASTHEVVAESFPQIVGMSQAIANAHLYAAAPDLIAACEAVLFWNSQGNFSALPVAAIMDMQKARELARAAILKAKGPR